MKHRAGWLLAAAFALGPGRLVAQNSDVTVWQGTLGREAIVVEKSAGMAGNPDCGGRYFYRRYRLDIRLDGKADATGACTMEELPARWSEDDPKPTWHMGLPAQGRWDGEWVGTDGRRLPIRLARVTELPEAAAPSLTALRGDFDPYTYLRLSTLTLRPDQRETVNGYGLRWLLQPDSDIRLFEVTSGYPPAAQAAINTRLHRRLWQWVEDQYQCRSGSEPGAAGFDAADATLRHIDARVVSVSLFTSYYCGGAHPDFGDAPLNIDARNGAELRLEDVLWLGKGDPVHQGAGKLDRAWAQYRQATFAPWVVAQFETLYPDEMRPPEGDDGCDYRTPDVWDFTDWYVLPSGIHLAAYFPRVLRVCDDPDWAVLPWRVVEAHPGPVRLH